LKAAEHELVYVNRRVAVGRENTPADTRHGNKHQQRPVQQQKHGNDGRLPHGFEIHGHEDGDEISGCNPV
jgi:hypothetical protein